MWAALAAGPARDMPVDPEGFGAHDAFELATIRGAEAIGEGDESGSLEPGKPADVPANTRSNPDEVRRVVDLMIDHARLRPSETLGVEEMFDRLGYGRRRSRIKTVLFGAIRSARGASAQGRGDQARP